MTSSRREWAERWVELWNSGDVERWLDEIGPDFEFTPDPSFPDAGSYRGEELRAWIREWARTWERNRFEMLEFREQGDAAVVDARWHLAAPGSGEYLPVQDFSIVLIWGSSDQEPPSRMAAFFDREEAERLAQSRTG